MTDDLNQMTPEQVLTGLRGDLEKQQKQHFSECEEIVKAGRERYGRTAFDEASQTVGAALGSTEAVQQFMHTIRQFDAPDDVIVHLSGNESRLREIAKLSAPRQAVEIARIEAQQAPYGHKVTGGERAWTVKEARTGKMSAEKWRETGGNELTDEQWGREFDRQMKARNGR
jgi:hypothetical protein